MIVTSPQLQAYSATCYFPENGEFKTVRVTAVDVAQAREKALQIVEQHAPGQPEVDSITTSYQHK